MKIGTSLSRCVRDIFDQKVKISDVVVIVARTDFDPENDSHWDRIWDGYGGNGVASVWSHPEWAGYTDHEQAFRDICIDLKISGKLHQPRQFGAFPSRLRHYWYDLLLTEEVCQSNPAAQAAWDNYKMIAGLSQ